MSDVAISALPALTPVPGASVLPVVSGGVTSKGTVTDIVKGGGALLADGSVPATANLPLGGHKVTGAADGLAGTDLTTVQQMNAAIAAGISTIFDVKQPVRLTTTTAMAASTRAANVRTANANGAMATINGVAPALNDRILDKDNATSADRGIWTVTSLGSGGTPWVLTRAADADTSAEVTPGLAVWSTEGTNKGQVFILVTPAPFTVNTSGWTFVDVQAIADDGVTTALVAGVISATGVFGSAAVRTTGVFVGASSGTPTATADGGSFESCTTGAGTLRGHCHRQASADAGGAGFTAQKCRGTHASPAAHNADDHIGYFSARGYDGSAFYTAGILRYVADAAGGTSKRVRFESLIHNGSALITGEVGLQAAATTTNATLTTVYSIPIAADAQTSIAIRWCGAQQSSSNRAFRETTLAVRRSGSGNVVEYAHSDGVSLQKDDAAWGDITQISYALNNTTHTVDITVQGKAAVNVDWTIDIVYSNR